MNTVRPNQLALCTLLALCVATPTLAGSTSGTFKLDDLEVKPTESAAFRIRDMFNPRQKQTYVMLTNKAVDSTSIVESLDPYTTAINDPAANVDHLTFSVDLDGKVTMNAKVGGTQYIDSTGKIMGEQGSLVAECSENTTTRVACTIKSAKPVKTDDGSWTLDVSFDSDVLARPAGKPMAKDGGDPAKAMFALEKAVGGSDLAAILALVTADVGTDFQRDYNTPEENLAWAKELLTMRIPKKAKVTGGEQLSDDHVLLEVEGEPWPDSKMLYEVEMRLVDGTWRYANGSTLGMLRD